jgi:hypothetical protein
MLLLIDCSKVKSMDFGGPQWHNFHTKFHENHSTGSEVECGGGWDPHTAWRSHKSIHLLQSMLKKVLVMRIYAESQNYFYQ